MKAALVFFSIIISFLFTVTANAQLSSIEALHGGWMADINGERHIYYIVLRNDSVSGVYCWDCENPHHLAFIDDGELTQNGLNFSLYHSPEGERPYLEAVEIRLQQGELHVSITGPNGNTQEQVFHRTPEEDKIVFPIANFRSNQGPVPGPRTLPGEVEDIDADKVIGMWLWGTGPTKQYFFFKEHKGGVRGMVCGPCDSVNDMAPLEQVTMSGTNFHFEIVHEDNGGAFAENGPHSNVTDAQVSKNEMLLSVIPSFDPSDSTPLEMTLLGPIAAGEFYRSVE